MQQEVVGEHPLTEALRGIVMLGYENRSRPCDIGRERRTQVRLAKMFVLAASAAVAAMAFVGAPSALASTTTLCLYHTENTAELEHLEGLGKINMANRLAFEEGGGLTCPSGLRYHEGEPMHFVNEGVGKLLNSLATVLCLTTLVNAQVLGEATLVAERLPVDAELTFGGCGTNTSHTNCTVAEEFGPIEGSVLRTGLDEGTLLANAGLATRLRVICNEVGIFKIKIDCMYDPSNIELTAGGLNVMANKTPLNPVEGSFFCPEESTIDGTLKTLEVTPVHFLE
jgi:hypothetical protein